MSSSSWPLSSSCLPHHVIFFFLFPLSSSSWPPSSLYPPHVLLFLLLFLLLMSSSYVLLCPLFISSSFSSSWRPLPPVYVLLFLLFMTLLPLHVLVILVSSSSFSSCLSLRWCTLVYEFGASHFAGCLDGVAYTLSKTSMAYTLSVILVLQTFC